MKRFKKITSKVLVLAVISAMSVTAFAAEDVEKNTRVHMNFEMPADGEKMPFGGGEGRGMGEGREMTEMKEREEFTEEEQAEMTAKMVERLEVLLAEGKITDEQYAEAIANMEDGKKPMNFGHRKDWLKGKERPEQSLTEE